MKKLLLFIFFGISRVLFAQADCTTALAVCGNSNITYNPVGIGNVNEILGGCLDTGEHNSIWYKITIATGGTLTFNLIPNDPQADYDWAIYGPNVTCGNLGAPIRCNAATVVGVGAATGLNMVSIITNAPGGSFTPYCRFLDVTAGQTYYLYIDNWVDNANPTVAPFSLTWGGTATLASPFTDPNTQPFPFNPPGIPAANPAAPREVTICGNPVMFDFSTLSVGIINGNPNFSVSYHTNQNDALTGGNPIIGSTMVNTVPTYFYSISYTAPGDPNSPLNKCKEIGTFRFRDRGIATNNVTLIQCNNNNSGTAIYDLTAANVIADPTVTKKYYSSLADLNANLNEITNPMTFTSAEGIIFVRVTSTFGCTAIAQIMLRFHPVMVVNDATLRSCSTESNPSTSSFNLTGAVVTIQAGAVRRYFPSVTDAVNLTNEILIPVAYIAPSGVVYVRVSSAQDCFNIAKITLVVIPPVYSDALKDKIICVEDKTTLDAGPGFDGYEWSTGALTQVINDVGVGTYWVKLRTGDCTVTQKVKVYASEQPVITSVEISNTTITINVNGGKASYQYSMDDIIWQDSNIFTNVKRGDHKIYVKDAYDCEPIEIDIVVPNFVNVITPNGDGINDVIDYSALSNKRNLIFNVFDRYGNKIFQADKLNNYKWDGTASNRKVPTGNYWYSVSWNENDKKGTPIKYSGWVLLKNRE